MRNRWWAAPVLAGGVAVLAACGSTASSSGGTPSTGTSATPSTTQQATGSGAVIKTNSTSKGTVLATAQGKTIYWFAIDTPAKSNCNGSCATYWPPVLGKPSAAAGTTLPKGFGTITRSDGKVQATYDGHPLYTYASGQRSWPGQRQRHERVRRAVVGDDADGRQARRGRRRRSSAADTSY